METLTLKVEGMACQHCVKAIKKALIGQGGIREVQGNLKEKEIILLGDGTWDKNRIKGIIQDMGYKVP